MLSLVVQQLIMCILYFNTNTQMIVIYWNLQDDYYYRIICLIAHKA